MGAIAYLRFWYRLQDRFDLTIKPRVVGPVRQRDHLFGKEEVFLFLVAYVAFVI